MQYAERHREGGRVCMHSQEYSKSPLKLKVRGFAISQLDWNQTYRCRYTHYLAPHHREGMYLVRIGMLRPNTAHMVKDMTV